MQKHYKMKKNILVIAPHADDEILGCGGSISKHIANGENVFILILTNANIGDNKIFSKKYIQKLHNESKKSHKFLNIKETFYFNFPAPSLHLYPNHKIANSIDKIIKKIKPYFLYLPFPGDMHLDHYFSYRASMVAARSQNNSSLENILCYEVPSETECSPVANNVFFKPNYFNDITNHIDNKIKSMEFYKSQLFKNPHPRSIDSIKNLSKYRGSTINVKHAEAFVVERLVKY